MTLLPHRSGHMHSHDLAMLDAPRDVEDQLADMQTFVQNPAVREVGRGSDQFDDFWFRRLDRSNGCHTRLPRVLECTHYRHAIAASVPDCTRKLADEGNAQAIPVEMFVIAARQPRGGFLGARQNPRSGVEREHALKDGCAEAFLPGAGLVRSARRKGKDSRGCLRLLKAPSAAVTRGLRDLPSRFARSHYAQTGGRRRGMRHASTAGSTFRQETQKGPGYRAFPRAPGVICPTGKGGQFNQECFAHGVEHRVGGVSHE